jgi:hypothetical protein
MEVVELNGLSTRGNASTVGLCIKYSLLLYSCSNFPPLVILRHSTTSKRQARVPLCTIFSLTRKQNDDKYNFLNTAVCVWPDLCAIINDTLMKGLTVALLKRNQICQKWRGFVNPIVGPRASKIHAGVCLLLQSLLRSSCKKWLIAFLCVSFGDRGVIVVGVLCYKLEGRWFDSRWCHWNFSLT